MRVFLLTLLAVAAPAFAQQRPPGIDPAAWDRMLKAQERAQQRIDQNPDLANHEHQVEYMGQVLQTYIPKPTHPPGP